MTEGGLCAADRFAAAAQIWPRAASSIYPLDWLVSRIRVLYPRDSFRTLSRARGARTPRSPRVRSTRCRRRRRRRCRRVELSHAVPLSTPPPPPPPPPPSHPFRLCSHHPLSLVAWTATAAHTGSLFGTGRSIQRDKNMSMTGAVRDASICQCRSVSGRRATI